MTWLANAPEPMSSAWRSNRPLGRRARRVSTAGGGGGPRRGPGRGRGPPPPRPTPARPHYMVCNADESETGTFKDRVLMEGDPFAVVEAMTIAGLATGCEHGYMYVRGEYPLARHRMESAVQQARERGFLGDDVAGTGARFDLQLPRGASAYTCGDETALFNSIAGKRGEPRNKPPFPVQTGLFSKPTLVNNVETLVNVLEILNGGSVAFAATGTPESTGTRLFCLSGHLRAPCVYEVPMGTTLRALIDKAGALRDGRS